MLFINTPGMRCQRAYTLPLWFRHLITEMLLNGSQPNLDQKYLCNGTINNRKETRLPYMPPNLANFGPQMAENGWRVFAKTLKVCAQDELQGHICDTFRFNHICQMAPMVDADAKNSVSVGKAAGRARSRWALPCHLVLLVPSKSQQLEQTVFQYISNTSVH